MKLIADILGSFLQIFILNYFFNRVLNNKLNSIVWKTTINLLSVLLYIVISTLIITSNIAPALFLLVVIFFSSLMYHDKFFKKLLYSLLIYVFGMLAEFLVGMVLHFIYDISVEAAQSNIYFYLQGILISKLLLFFVLRIINLLQFNNKTEINIKSVLSILIIPLSSIASIYFFANVAYNNENAVSPVVILVVTSLTILSNVSTFYLLERQMKLQNTEETLRNMEKQYKLQADYYTELKQNMIVSNKNVHDTKNFIAAISSYIDNQKSELAKSKIEEFYGKIPGIKTIETGNDAVNALVQSKLSNIKSEIPNNRISIIIPEQLKIEEIDLCILIGNALDNAIEASKKLADKNVRMLEIKIFPVNGQLSMLFVNTKAKSALKAPGIFNTTKPDPLMHGFGIENMKNICRKYDASISFEQTEDRFTVSILLPN